MLDILFFGMALRKNALQQTIDQVAQEMQLDVEAVPIDEFVPVPSEADARRVPFGLYGVVEVYILDPYTIAFSKLDRGFDTDLEDVLFLLRQELIQLELLEQIIATAMRRALQFDLDPNAMQEHLWLVRNQL